MDKPRRSPRWTRLTGILAAAGTAVCGTALTASAANAGDLNGEGAVTHSDAVLLQ